MGNGLNEGILLVGVITLNLVVMFETEGRTTSTINSFIAVRDFDKMKRSVPS